MALHDIHAVIDEEITKLISSGGNDFILSNADSNIMGIIVRHMVSNEQEYVKTWYLLRSLSRMHRNRFSRNETYANMGSIKAIGMLIGFKIIAVNDITTRIYGKPNYNSSWKNQLFYCCRLCGSNIRSVKKRTHVNNCPIMKKIIKFDRKPCEKCGCAFQPPAPKQHTRFSEPICPFDDWDCNFCRWRVNYIEFVTKHYSNCGSIRDSRCQWCKILMSRIEFASHELCKSEYVNCSFCGEKIYIQDNKKRIEHDDACKILKEKKLRNAISDEISVIAPVFSQVYIDAVTATQDITLLKEISDYILPSGTIKIEYGIASGTLRQLKGIWSMESLIVAFLNMESSIILKIANFSLVLTRQNMVINGKKTAVYCCIGGPNNIAGLHPIIKQKFACMSPISLGPNGEINFLIPGG